MKRIHLIILTLGLCTVALQLQAAAPPNESGNQKTQRLRLKAARNPNAPKLRLRKPDEPTPQQRIAQLEKSNKRKITENFQLAVALRQEQNPTTCGCRSIFWAVVGVGGTVGAQMLYAALANQSVIEACTGADCQS